jgi:hypothetical protein
MDVTMIVLRLLHIVAGVFWAGSLFFLAGLMLKAVRETGPAGGRVMRQLIGAQKLPAQLGGAAIVTILSGAAMYWHNYSLTAGAFASSRPGMAYGAGAIAALVTLAVGLGVVAPTGAKLVALGGAIEAGGKPPTPEQASTLGVLQGKMRFAARLAAATVAIAVITMAVARYL